MKKDKILEPLEGKRGLVISSLNIRSLLPKIAQIECLLEEEDIGVLGLNETWLGNNVSNNQIRINNYKIYRWDRKTGKRGEGLCAYVHKSLLVDAEKFKELNISTEHIELAVLQISKNVPNPI